MRLAPVGLVEAEFAYVSSVIESFKSVGQPKLWTVTKRDRGDQLGHLVEGKRFSYIHHNMPANDDAEVLVVELAQLGC